MSQNQPYAYFIGAGVEHSAKLIARCRAIDVFADADRYQPRP